MTQSSLYATAFSGNIETLFFGITAIMGALPGIGGKPSVFLLLSAYPGAMPAGIHAKQGAFTAFC